MLRFIALRLLGALPVLLAVSLISFGVIWFVPGDPVSSLLDASATPEEIRQVRAQLGLDGSPLDQLAAYYGRLLRGDLGQSILLGQPVAEAIIERLPITLALTVLSMAIALSSGIALGVVAAVKRGSRLDQAVMGASLVGLSLPDFWFGLVLVFLFSVALGWLPTGGYVPLTEDPWGWTQSMLLPAFTLGTSQMALVARMTRSSMLEVLGQDYIRTARAKGASPVAVLLRHGLRNALVPVVTVAGLSFGLLLSGAVVVELVFSLPGMGRLIIGGVLRRDYPVIQGGLLFSAAIFVLVNVAVDILYGVLDPKVRARAA